MVEGAEGNTLYASDRSVQEFDANERHFKTRLPNCVLKELREIRMLSRKSAAWMKLVALKTYKQSINLVIGEEDRGSRAFEEAVNLASTG